MAYKMIEIKVSELFEGDVLAADVYNSNGKVLITKNTTISENIILGLKKNYIDSVYIYRDMANEEIKDIIIIKDILIKKP